MICHGLLRGTEEDQNLWAREGVKGVRVRILKESLKMEVDGKTAMICHGLLRGTEEDQNLWAREGVKGVRVRILKESLKMTT